MQISAVWALAAAGGALALSLAPALVHWRRRAAAGKSEPARLLDPPWRPAAVDVLVVVLTFVAVGLCESGALAPLATLLAAYALFVVGHCRALPAAGTLGLALVGLAVSRAAIDWLPPYGFNLLLGLTAAAWLMHWFAIFWHQQLHNGKPWTTAGVLAPRAEMLSHVFLAGALAAYGVTAGVPVRPSWGGGLCALVMLAMCVGFARRAGRPDARLSIRRASRCAAYALGCIATAPVCVLLAGIFHWSVLPLMLAACLAALLLLLALA